MANYVIIDTCIYKELGFKFHTHPDLINIHAFTIATDGEMIISPIVMAEFINHYEIEIRRKETAYNKVIKDLERDSFFKMKKNKFPSISERVEAALVEFKVKFLTDPKHEVPNIILASWDVNSLDVTEFILKSRNLGIKEVQVRDYLIWHSILKFTQKHNLERTADRTRNPQNNGELDIVTFITKDDGFTNNPLFFDLQKKNNITNIEIVKSIPEYLHLKGYNLPYVTKELIMSEISADCILNDVDRDLGALLTYISPLFNRFDENNPEAILKEVKDLEIIEFYSYKDSFTGEFKFVVHMKAVLNVVFEKSERFGIPPTSKLRYLETYDNQNRPVFNHPVLFMYDGLLDNESKTIKSINLVDFLPWVYIYSDIN